MLSASSRMNELPFIAAVFGSLEIITLVIAVVGLVLSIVALAWQIMSWRLTGSVVRVVVSHGLGVGGSWPQLVAIEAMNVGRTPVSVHGWGFRLPDGRTLWPAVGHRGSWAGPAVPLTLDPGHSASWQVDAKSIRATLMDEALPNAELRGFVNLGTGEQRRSRKTIRL
jgi:hypothetical protein